MPEMPARVPDDAPRVMLARSRSRAALTLRPAPAFQAANGSAVCADPPGQFSLRTRLPTEAEYGTSVAVQVPPTGVVKGHVPLAEK